MPFFLQYSAKLLKKPDQCRAVYACSHLFWVEDQENMKDGERYSTVHLTFTNPRVGGKNEREWERYRDIQLLMAVQVICMAPV